MIDSSPAREPKTMLRNGLVGAVILVGSILLGSCGGKKSIPQVAELPALTRTGVQAGDRVSLAFYTAAGDQLDEISGDRDVDDNGELFLPFLGKVDVLGLAAEDIRLLLEERYGTLYADPVIEVTTNVRINVTGAVRNAGRYFVPPSSTLVDALAGAGGASSEVDLGLQGGASDPSKVRLVRDGVVTVIDLRPLEVRPAVLSLRIQSGDWLHVPRAVRSQIKEDITFYGSGLSVLLTLASLIVLIAR